MSLFREFIDAAYGGNQAKAAAALEVDRSLVSRILRGERGITPELAQRIEAVSEGRFRKEAFIWPAEIDTDGGPLADTEPTKAEAA